MEKDQHQSLLEAISTPEPILVVDDDTDVLQMILQWVLEDEGFEVQTATDGQEALILAKQRNQHSSFWIWDYLSLMAVT